MVAYDLSVFCCYKIHCFTLMCFVLFYILYKYNHTRVCDEIKRYSIWLSIKYCFKVQYNKQV